MLGKNAETANGTKTVAAACRTAAIASGILGIGCPDFRRMPMTENATVAEAATAAAR